MFQNLCLLPVVMSEAAYLPLERGDTLLLHPGETFPTLEDVW